MAHDRVVCGGRVDERQEAEVQEVEACGELMDE